MSESTGRWITLKGGRRVFIEEGKSITDTIKKYDKEKGKKTLSTKKQKSTARINKKAKDNLYWEEQEKLENKTNELANKHGLSDEELLDHYEIGQIQDKYRIKEKELEDRLTKKYKRKQNTSKKDIDKTIEERGKKKILNPKKAKERRAERLEDDAWDMITDKYGIDEIDLYDGSDAAGELWEAADRIHEEVYGKKKYTRYIKPQDKETKILHSNLKSLKKKKEDMEKRMIAAAKISAIVDPKSTRVDELAKERDSIKRYIEITNNQLNDKYKANKKPKIDNKKTMLGFKSGNPQKRYKTASPRKLEGKTMSNHSNTLGKELKKQGHSTKGLKHVGNYIFETDRLTIKTEPTDWEKQDKIKIVSAHRIKEKKRK